MEENIMSIETLLAFGIGLNIVKIIVLSIILVLVFILVKQVIKLVAFVLHLPVAAVKSICKHFEKESKKVEKKNRK